MSTHIEANSKRIAPHVLLPGDPLRAKYIAENFLQNHFCYNEVRGMLGYSGYYKTVPVSIQGTGMGIPSISIYATELFRQYNVKYAVRVGTCGAMQPDVKLRDIILAEGACTDSDFNHYQFAGTYCPIANFEMLRGAYKKAGERGLAVKVGNVYSTDIFYNADKPGEDMWSKYGVLGVEMETAALYTLAAKNGVKAMSVLTVSDSGFTKEVMTSEERRSSLDSAIELALDTLIMDTDGMRKENAR